MKKPFMTLCLLVSAMVFPPAMAAQPDGFSPADRPGEIVARISSQSGNIETIHSSFIQKKQLQFLDETIVSKGEFWFRKENSLRWAYREPYPYAIIIQGGTFRIVDGTQVSDYDIESNAVFTEVNNMIIGMVRGDILNEDRFGISVFEDPSSYLVRLTPLDPNIGEVISEMEIYFSREDLMVKKIVMKESEEDFTEITFTDRKINEIIPDTVFNTGR
jgi:outer membrane lipoprotein-sorting protein